MPVRILESTLYQRRLKKVAGGHGVKLDWNDKELLQKVHNELQKIVSISAKGVEALAKSMVPVGETRKLKRSIKASRSTRYSGIGTDKRAHVSYIIQAGNDTDINYASYVELGRYFKDTKTRVPAVPFIRRPVHIMRKKMRRLFIKRLRRLL